MNTGPRTRPRLRWTLPAVFLVAAVAVGCNSPTAPAVAALDPALSALLLTGAQVVVGQQVVNGQTMQAGQPHGASTLFQATLSDANGGPALGHTVQVQYQTPGGGPGGMMNGQGELHLYDDGTHGDPIAGDGVYCFEDQQGQYGFHMPWAPVGQYHYEFFGFTDPGHHSNHMTVSVSIAPGTATASSLQLSNAQVMVNGQVVNGRTMQPGQTHGDGTFFQATLSAHNGPALGHTVQVQYQLPQGGMGHGHMAGGEGFLHLYDDGTHGDPIAGDGIYCFDDQLGQFGLHMQNAPHGQYHYEFFGFDHEDHHSNHMKVLVTIASG